MKRNTPTSYLLLFIATLLLSSCYELKVIPKDAMPATADTSVTKCAFFWGIWEPTIIEKGCYGNGITNVKSKTNLGFILISFVTLGIVVPITVEWSCAKDNM